VILPPAELLERMAPTLRKEIGPAVEGEYPRTQAFMAAVILEKVARQLALTPTHELADAVETAELVADLDGLLSAGSAPPAVRAIVTDDVAGGGDDALCRLIEALYSHRDALGAPTFDTALRRVRATLRARVDRQMEYAG
jgi:hypothetical protein